MNTRLFLDMDNVFCEFDQGLCELAGIIYPEKEPDFYKRWAPVMLKDGKDAFFFDTLPTMSGGEDLWQAVTKYLASSGQRNPIFLTGCPRTPFRHMSGEGKAQWVRKNIIAKGLWHADASIYTLYIKENSNFDEDSSAAREMLEQTLTRVQEHDIIMIFCGADEKQFFSVPLSDGKVPVLLDDREPEKTKWESRGQGIYLHHEYSIKLDSSKDCHSYYPTFEELSKIAVSKSIRKLEDLQSRKNAKRFRRTRRSRNWSKQ